MHKNITENSDSEKIFQDYENALVIGEGAIILRRFQRVSLLHQEYSLYKHLTMHPGTNVTSRHACMELHMKRKYKWYFVELIWG